MESLRDSDEGLFCCRKYQIVFCYTIIERNNRNVLPVVRSSAGGECVSTNTNPLDSFFPFDPYLLKRCVCQPFTLWTLEEMSSLLSLLYFSYNLLYTPVTKRWT